MKRKINEKNFKQNSIIKTSKNKISWSSFQKVPCSNAASTSSIEVHCRSSLHHIESLNTFPSTFFPYFHL